MSERFCDLDDEKKAECTLAEEPTDEAWLYCESCHRAMHQGDCPVQDDGVSLRCAYEDCDLGGDPSHQNLSDWDAHRKSRAVDMAKWPTDPMMGARYY